MKQIFIMLMVFLLLTSCGAPVKHYKQGFDETTGVKLIADNLIGKSILVNGKKSRITVDDLTRYHMGIAGAKNSEPRTACKIVLKSYQNCIRSILKPY